MSIYSKKLFCRSIFALFLIVVIGGAARAEQFPIKTFTSADGLASSALTNIFRDHLGFIWFSTRDGLSRYDGREFTNFRLGDDSSPTVFSFHETKCGDFWIVTNDGLYRVRHQDSPEVKPESAAKNDDRRVLLNAEKISDISFNAFYEDSAGQIWTGGADGLFKLSENNGRVSINKIEIGAANNVKTITEARDESLWIGSNEGVFRRLPDGKYLFYPIARSSGYDEISKITEDSGGRIWIAHTRGIFIIQPETAPNVETRELSVKEQIVTADFALPEIAPDTILRLIFKEDEANRQEAIVHDIFAASDSKIWFSAQGFLYSFFGGRVRRVSDSAILPFYIQNFAEDLAGNLWIGTNSGALRLTRQGFTTFKQNDGLGDGRIFSMSENSAGEFLVGNGRLRVSRFENGKFVSKPFNLPDSAKLIYATSGVLFDENNLWALTENGLYRFDVNDLQTPLKVYDKADGLKGNALFCGFKDSKGNLWFSTRKNSDVDGLNLFDQTTQKFHAFSTDEDFPNGKSPASFAEDANGNLWFGFYDGGLVKYANGRFTDFSAAENLPSGGIFGLHVDAKNRLWIASSSGGVAVVEDLQSDELKFRRITTAQGLASNNARCLTEDLAGNIYAGTVRGIDRITPETGQIKHFSTSDGLSGDFVNTAFRDKNGTLWFGTSNGLSKFEPQADFAQTAPEIFISGLQIAGVGYSVSGFGQKEIGGISVGAGENNLEISFLSVGAGENTRFQYKLEDSETEQDWSAASEKNSINLARLASGTYKFSVRAVNSAGVTSEVPAVVSFKIEFPFWQRWWFLLLCGLVVVGVILSIERTRAARLRESKRADEIEQKAKSERLRELEQVRRRIAADLHDDIGSSLTQISIWSEVLQRNIGEQSGKSVSEPLTLIGNSSRELIDAMSDIVWAINPQKDFLSELSGKMRRFASDVFSARNIEFTFDAPHLTEEFALGANFRREIYLIFKESVNNIVKHSNCTKVEIILSVENSEIRLNLHDDGAGFDANETTDGHGLASMKARADGLGGKLEIVAGGANGTFITLSAPLGAVSSDSV